MDRARIGIIVFNDNTGNCFKTIVRLLDTVRQWRNEIRVSIIWCEEPEPLSGKTGSVEEMLNLTEITPETIQDIELEMITDEILMEFARQNSITVYTSEKFSSLLSNAIADMDADYIHMTPGNVGYTEEFWTEIFAHLKTTTCTAFTTKVRMKNPSPVIREHNAYINKKTQLTESPFVTMEDCFYSYHLIHEVFYSYFVKKEELMLDILPDLADRLHWTLDIIYLFTCTMSKQKDIEAVSSAALSKYGQAELFDWNMLLNKEKEFLYLSGFLERMYTFCCAYPENKNAKYNLLYYIKMQILYHPGGSEDIIVIRQKTEEMISFIQDAELIFENQYFDRVLKKHILENFAWKEDSSFKEKKQDIFDNGSLENALIFIQIDKNKVILEGRSMMFGEEDFDIYIKCNEEETKCKIVGKESFRKWFDSNITHTEYYSCEIPLNQGESYELNVICKKENFERRKTKISFSMYTPLTENVELFARKEGWIFYYDKKYGRLVIRPDQFLKRFILKLRRGKSFLLGDKIAKKAFLARGLYHVLNAFKKKEIWLISDRIKRGDDNGECFFRYLSEHPQKDVNAYFVVDKECPAYEQMKQYGKVIPVYSWKHKIYHLLSDYVISSQANKPVINPFGKIYYHYSDLLYDKKIVFLQHGVTKDDQSAWLNRYNRNLYGFVVATKAEYNSIFEADYFYEPKNIWLTGLPRYDRLYNNEKKYITIMPTWRKSLSAGTTAAGEWKISNSFADSKYFKFYNGLLNNERLILAAQKRGYTICFMPHPNITPALPLFKRDERVKFWDADKSYRDVFAEANLIVTDYSSVAFDFAYLRKPIVYCQFDREEFFAGGHSYTEGYYNYQTDGFGEIVETLEDLVDKLIEYMDNNCMLKEEYRQRIENTFAYADTNCCARVLERIREER